MANQNINEKYNETIHQLELLLDELMSVNCNIQGIKVRIYNNMREVAYSKMTAQNAVIGLVEDYHDLQTNSDRISKIEDIISNLIGRKG